jgi:peptidyl-prolyl cis-trans isomerase SurA
VIKYKKILIVILFLFSTISVVNSAVEDSLFATVGRKALTKSDIVEEIKIILILNNEKFEEDKRKTLEQSAVKSVIRKTIKEIELEKFEYTKINLKDLDSEINKRAKSLGLNIEEFEERFKSNNLNFRKYKENIKVELMWNSLMYQIYKVQLSVNKNEVEEQLKLFENETGIQEYLISEIIVKPNLNEEIDVQIKKIKEKIEFEGFEIVAKNLSISETAMNEGNLGWVRENMISKNFKSAIINTEIGKLSEPIILSDSILFFKVNNKRESKKFSNMDEAKKSLELAEKNKILNMYSLTHFNNLKRSIPIKYY